MNLYYNKKEKDFIISNQSKIQKAVKKLNPIEDLMFRKMAEEKIFCEEILRVILSDPELVVLETNAQWARTNLQVCSVILDAKCKLKNQKQINDDK